MTNVPKIHKLDPNEKAVVIDKHTGKLQARFEGFGAQRDAESFLRQCVAGKVRHLSSACIVTGDKAAEAIRKGRL